MSEAELNSEATAYEATPHKVLREQIMDPHIPKNEREWWAAREIERLERECNQLKADWNKACDEQLILMLECDGHRAKAAKLREALQSVMDWNPKPEPTDRPQTVARFEADMEKARKILEETE